MFLRLLLQSLSYGLPDGAQLAPQLLALAPGERDGGGLGERAWEMVLIMEMRREIRLLVDCGIPRSQRKEKEEEEDRIKGEEGEGRGDRREGR